MENVRDEDVADEDVKTASTIIIVSAVQLIGILLLIAFTLPRQEVQGNAAVQVGGERQAACLPTSAFIQRSHENVSRSLMKFSNLATSNWPRSSVFKQ